MLRTAKKRRLDQDSKYAGSKLEIGAALVMSAFFLFVHLFFTGTYAVLAVICTAQTLACTLLTAQTDCGVSKLADKRFNHLHARKGQFARGQMIT